MKQTQKLKPPEQEQPEHEFATMSEEIEWIELDSEEPIRQTNRQSRNYRSWSKRIRIGRQNKCKNDNKLSTNMFGIYLEILWNKILDDKRNSYTYLDCLWFQLYINEHTKGRVLRWIKQKEIFSKRYVFVPIIRWGHWSLLVLCHFGEAQESNSGKPCMLLLDSLHGAGPERLEPDIRRFVCDIYKAEGKEHEHLTFKIPLLIPKVPQQTNDEECGMFVLYFIYLFMLNAPTIFIQEKYPYFLNEDWFKLEDLRQFSKEIDIQWIGHLALG